MSTDKHEMIRRRAHEIWENEGRPDGAEQRHWQQACEELGNQDAQGPRQDQDNSAERHDSPTLAGADASGKLASARGEMRQKKKKRSAEPVPQIPDVEITTGEKPARPKIRKTEGP